MKPKSFEIEAFTISYAAKKLGYKSTKTIYRLLKRGLLEEYVYLEKSGRIYLILEPPNLLISFAAGERTTEQRTKKKIKRKTFSHFSFIAFSVFWFLFAVCATGDDKTFAGHEPGLPLIDFTT